VYQGAIQISSPDNANLSQTVNVKLTVTAGVNAPLIANGGIVDAATFSSSAVAAGSIASVFGGNLSSGIAAASVAPSPSSSGRGNGALSLPTSVLATQVLINDVPAPLFYVSPNQINFQVPPGITGTIPVVVVSNGVRGEAATVDVKDVAPRIFTVAGSPQGAVLNEDSSPNSAQNAASAGTVIQIFADGLGLTNPPAQAGQIAGTSPLATTIATPSVTIGGIPAEVLFSGLAPGTAGLYQVNARIPAGTAAGPAVPLQVQMGASAGNVVTISVR